MGDRYILVLSLFQLWYENLGGILMAFRKVRDEVNALINDMPIGFEFRTADLYLVCTHRNTTMASVGHAIRNHPRIKCITTNPRQLHVWKVIA